MVSHLKFSDYAAEIWKIVEAMDEWAAEHDGDISEFPMQADLDKLEAERDEKALRIAYVIKQLRAEAKAIAEEQKALVARRKTIENSEARLKEYLERCLPEGHKVKDSRSSIHWSKTIVLDFAGDEINPRELPEEFQKVKIEADVVGIKNALKSGREIDGFALETKTFTVIK